jgi:hypothetical protein
MVVDEEQTLGTSNGFDGLGNLLTDRAGVVRLEPQLHRWNAQLHHLIYPLGIWDNRIKS